MGEPVRYMEIPANCDPLHETSDARIQPLAYFLAGLGASLILVAAMIWILFSVLLATIHDEFIERRTADTMTVLLKEPPLQVSPRADIDALRKRDEKALQTIGWIDRERGIARVPIEAAMEMVANNGVPMWPPASAESVNSNVPPSPVTDDAPFSIESTTR
jgi:hypothetical protein